MNARLTLVFALSACMIAGCANRSQQLPTADIPGTNTIAPDSTGSGDKWTTFAYDYQRTGFNPNVKTITTANVNKLTLRWKVNLSSVKIAASPVVYAGNMIVVTAGSKGNGPTAEVYDLSTADGHTIWKYHLGATSKLTPTIDPAAGIVIVGNGVLVNRKTSPSHLVALNLLDGKVAWSVSEIGLFHSAPVVTGGTVYAGFGYGDPPLCFQGGVLSINETTGTVNWNWSVDPTPHEGGGVWGAVSYDGTHPIFGTGNTCQTPITTADGAVSLDSTGKVNWNLVAVKKSNADSDTGGGVMLHDGRGYFINKNGMFYSISEATGTIHWSTDLNSQAQSPTWNGGFATPTTDGNTLLVGTGLYKGSSTGSGGEFCFADSTPDEVFAGYHSELQALNFSGRVLWTRTMQNRIVGYVAMLKGIGFVGLNREFVALDTRTGKTLWSYATPAYIDASMVIVPSGVYGADDAGNVYAFALPS
jgi:outer membrane protein assembly factor BamB